MKLIVRAKRCPNNKHKEISILIYGKEYLKIEL